MADEEIPMPPTNDEGRNIFGRLSAPEKLPQPTSRFELDWNPGDFDSDSPKLSIDEATRIIAKRLPVDRGFIQMLNRNSDRLHISTSVPESLSNLAMKVAQLMPDDLLTRDALENMDLRAPLQQLMMAPAQQNADGTSEINGLEFTDMERKLAGYTMVTLTERYETAWQTSEADKVNEGGDVDRQTAAIERAVQDTLVGFREGTVVRIPDAKSPGTSYGLDENGRLIANSDNVVSQAVADEFNAEYDDQEISIEQRFLSAQDIQKMLAGGEITIDYLREIEQMDMAADPTATDPNAPRTISHGARVTYTDELRDSGNRLPDHLAGPDRRDMEKDWYSVTEVLQLPSSFTPDERVAMVKRLENAGFLEKGEVVAGDTTSAAFKDAWKTLAQAALERGVSMTSFLDEREQQYQETIMSSFATRLTDPARLRISGDTIGKSVLGRALTADEQAEMIKWVHDLERKNAMTSAGLDVQEGEEIEGVSALDEGILADIDARMEEWVRSENDVEAGAKDVADQYEAFSRMLAGPGRGI